MTEENEKLRTPAEKFVRIFQAPLGLAGPLYIAPPSADIKVKSHSPPRDPPARRFLKPPASRNTSKTVIKEWSCST